MTLARTFSLDDSTRVSAGHPSEREARCTTSSDSTLLADSELVFEFCVRPHMTEKIDFYRPKIDIFRNFILLM